MTPEERMGALIRGEKPDRIPVNPFIFGHAARITQNITIYDMYTDPRKNVLAFRLAQELYGFDAGPMLGYASMGALEFGGEIEYPTGEAQAPSVKKHPVQTPEDVEKLKIPEAKTAGETPKIIEHCKLTLELMPSGVKMPIFQNGESFTYTGNIIGVDKMMLWMMKQPRLVHKVLRMVTDFLVEAAKAVVDEVGPISVFDGGPTSSNDLISPKQFKEFVLPYVKETHERVIKLGVPGYMTHPCGNQTLNVDMWAEIPGIIGVLVGDLTNLELWKEKLGKNTIIMGNICPSHFVDYDFDYIYNEAKRCIRTAGDSPHGYVLGPGCDMPPDTPPTNIYALMKAARESIL